MSQRAKLLMAGTALVAALGLTAATNAWFVSLSRTPAGVVHSALVRCLPESGPERDTASLLTYGSLVSGSGVDTDGVPLILPGDSLLSMQTWTDNSRVVRTSLARDFQDGETPGTVIHRTERTDANGVTATMTQRDLMHAYETSSWYEGDTATGTPVDPVPSLDLSAYTAVTTAATTVESPNGKTITTVTLTTVYTPRNPEDKTFYTYVHNSIEEVTHEAASYYPDQDAYNGIIFPNLTYKTDETVLSVDTGKTVTHSYLIITETPGAGTPSGDGKTDPVPLPLTLGNLSTADVNIRVGLNATITRTKDSSPEVTPLVLRSGMDATDKGAYFLGMERAADNAFIELFRFKPASSSTYEWVKSTDETDSKTWSLFDLSLKNVEHPLDIPPPAQPTAPPDPAASGTPETPAPTPSPAPEETPPDLYAVIDALQVVSKSSFGVDKTPFEQSFNELYCSGAPTIRLSVHFYVRQSEYMAWSEFYSDSLSFTVPAQTP